MTDHRIICGDSLHVLPTLDAESVDAIVCDPPYGLSFMGKEWDHGVPGEAFWREALRVAKPGAHLLAFGGSRTYHRLACAIEDAGWEIRDCLSWLYGSGFPKSHNLDGDKQGWGTALKPAWEPIIFARKSLVGTVASNVAQYGTGALNVDGCRIGTDATTRPNGPIGFHGGGSGGIGGSESGRWPANVVLDDWQEEVLYLRDSVPVDVANLIREFYRGYSRVPSVWQRTSGVSEQGQAQPLLQPNVLGGVDVHASARREAPDARAASLGTQPRSDATEEACDDCAGIEKSDMARREVQRTRVCDDLRLGVERVGQGVGFSDDATGTGVCAGASTCDGESDGQATDPAGGGASSERREERQQAGEPRNDGRCDAQDGASGNRSGAEGVAGGERTLAVLACDVPTGWRGYFTVAGVVRSPDSAAWMLDAQSGERSGKGGATSGGTALGQASGWNAHNNRVTPIERRNDTGGASRFFYTAKASRREREAGLEGMPRKANDFQRESSGLSRGKNPETGELKGAVQPSTNHHPTVKPIALMRWLCRLVTPPNGLVLDPFTGSGSTGCAAVLEGFRFVGVEREPEYAAIAEKRIAHWAGQRDEPSLFDG